MRPYNQIMRIRPFGREDLHAIVSIQAQSPEAARWTPTDYERLADAPGGRILVAEMETADPPKVLGFAAFHRVLDEAELRNMAVDPAHRQQGVARALLVEARCLLLRDGARRVFLEVRASNKAALALYSSLGFAVHSLRRNYYHDPPDDACVMCLEIHPPQTSFS